MIYVGMDVSSKSFEIYAVKENNKVVLKEAIEPSRKGLKDLIKKLGREKKIFIFEAGNQMKWIAETFKKADEMTHVVHPNEVKWIVNSRGKTDKVDAKKLAELGRADMLPRPVFVTEGKERKLRELVSARSTLMSKRVALVNTIQGYAKQEGHRLPTGFFRNDEWTLALDKTKFSETLKTIIAAMMNAYESIKKSEQDLATEINSIEDKRIELIKTVPAIGDLSARVILSALVNAERFDNSKCVANYCALTPTIYQSGDVVRLGRVNRDGRGEVRRIGLQCAHTIMRMKSPEVKPLQDFYNRIMKRSNKKKAVVALARKLITTIYGVLKSGEVYDYRKLIAA
jgi:transposase